MMRGRVLDSTLTPEIARKLQGLDVNNNEDESAKDTMGVEESATGPRNI